MSEGFLSYEHHCAARNLLYEMDRYLTWVDERRSEILHNIALAVGEIEDELWEDIRARRGKQGRVVGLWNNGYMSTGQSLRHIHGDRLVVPDPAAFSWRDRCSMCGCLHHSDDCPECTIRKAA